LKDANAVSLLKILNIDYYKTADVLKKAGVIVPEDIYEFKKLFRNLIG